MIIHEHLFSDLTRDTANNDSVLNDVELCYRELMRYKESGGISLIDQTTAGLRGHDHDLLEDTHAVAVRKMAEKTGLNIILGAGWYRAPYYEKKLYRMKTDENADELFIQTTLGRLVITKDKVISVQEERTPGPKVEMVGDPFVNAYPDREEIIGTVINNGELRADFVRTEANLWSPTTQLIVKDSAFVDGNMITYKSGVISDTSIDPGQTASFKIVIQKPLKPEVQYRTYDISWTRTN